jgi:hypothetical protein
MLEGRGLLQWLKEKGMQMLEECVVCTVSRLGELGGGGEALRSSLPLKLAAVIVKIITIPIIKLHRQTYNAAHANFLGLVRHIRS